MKHNLLGQLKKMINKNDLIYLAGSSGLVGSATKKCLIKNGYINILEIQHNKYDLRNQNIVNEIFNNNNIKYVIDAAALVGGILANSTYPYNFIYDNITIQTNIINAAKEHNIQKLIFLGSSCIYPRNCPQPIKQEYLLSSELQPTNQWYAIAKIAGVKLCQAFNKQYGTKFISLMPTNLYGEEDNFDLESSHVLPAMIRKFHEALPDKDVVLLGTGQVYREFMHVNDLAKCILFLLENDVNEDLYNVGTGKDLKIEQLAYMIQIITGHTGKICWDITKPDGTPKKLLDVSKIHNIGWKHSIELFEGLQNTYKWFLQNINNLKIRIL